MKFVDVILPLALQKLFTYSVPDELNIQVEIGKRVVVQFGSKKLYTAIVRNVHHEKPAYDTKDIISVLDEFPLVNQQQFDLWDWMAEYYLCTLGEVMSAALPSGLKLESETKIQFHPGFKIDTLFDEKLNLSENEIRVLEALKLKKKELTVTDISVVLHRKNVFPFIQGLINRGIIIATENIIKKYKPKTESYISLSEKAKNENWLQTIFEKIEKKSPKQLDVLMTFMKVMTDERADEMLKSRLLDISGTSPSALNELIKKGVFQVVEQSIDRLKPIADKGFAPEIIFNDFQQTALNEIKEHFFNKDVVLLHGVTSSGKTEMYIQLITDTIAQGKQVLYLLPEIALTTQIIRRLQVHFGNRVGIYHSRYSDNERVEVWNKVLNSSRLKIPDLVLNTQHSTSQTQSSNYEIILGARSSLFLPFNNLGLIIVDEEHETSFKQQDPAPRYHARDSAIILAKNHDAKVLLGSATPSIESYYNATSGKFGLVNLTQRFGGLKMPEIEVVNIREESRKKRMKSHFSPGLIDFIRMALNSKEQIILFQNRRGFAPFLECPSCGWTPHCINCDVSLVFHKQSNRLRCHYCGYHQEPPNKCIACAEPAIKMMGFGTEKIEEELSIFFPEAIISRLDMDTARSRSSFQQLIYDFEKGKIDILVGTQMVTKGLDFDNVSTVGIMNADTMLKFPDFRAFERSYQLMAQVSGRSGRKTKQGKVIIQSGNPEHSVIEFVIKNDYEGFYQSELAERTRFGFPPIVRLVEISLKHKDISFLNKSADQFADALRKSIFNNQQQAQAVVLGPELPLVARVRNLYIKKVLLKIARNQNLSVVKQKLKSTVNEFKSKEENRSVIIQLDVDPM